MRFATYSHDASGAGGAVRAGVVDGELIHPLPAGVTLLGLLQAGRMALHAAGAAALAGTETVELSTVRLHSPLYPPSIRDFVAFEAHVDGVVKMMEGLAA